MASDDQRRIIVNAQGFPSDGLAAILTRLQDYKYRYQVPLILSISGLPDDGNFDIHWDRTRQLIRETHPYVDGYVDNKFSPNTTSLVRLRTPEIYRGTAELFKSHSPDKPFFAKMGPFETFQEEEQWMPLAQAWLDGGGTGLNFTNTKKIEYPDFPYKTGGMSGAELAVIRQRMLKKAQARFPYASKLVSGGFFTSEDVYQSFKDGADYVGGYTCFAFQGFGLVTSWLKGVRQLMKGEGYDNLMQIFDSRKYK